jgi:ArsR family transcriptional regulator, virulence genes transcriptional regulator
LTLYSEIRIYATMKIQTDIMHAAADQASELLKSLANRHRLLILCQLVDGERSVGDLAAFVGVRDSTVSQHLALLRKDGLVQARREGQTIYYAIASDPARQVLETLFAVYCSTAPICAEPAPEPKRRGQRRAA